MANLKKVSKNESYSRTAKVEGQIVRFQHNTLHKVSNVHYLLNTAFDFTGVDAATILRLAGETLLIRWRTAFKDAETVDDSADNQVVTVREMLKGRKPRMSKGEKAINLVASMTPEEQAALLATLQAKVAKKEAARKG